MSLIERTILILFMLILYEHSCHSAKINTPRVLLPWFENLQVNFTFEIIEGGCYKWSLSRDDSINLEPLYEDSWGHCSHAARVSVSKICVPPSSVIILTEEINTGTILRGDVDIDKISYLKVMSTTWRLYLEEAPEAFEVVAYDDQGNTFSTLEGVTFTWTIKNQGKNVGEDPLVTLVDWSNTDYEAPHGITEIEALGLRSHTVLLYGQAIGECIVSVCFENICTDFSLHVIASVVLTPAIATIALGDTLQYRVVRARAGRLTVQDIGDTMYTIKVPDNSVAYLEDSVSQLRGKEIGTTEVFLMSGMTSVASATLIVAEPYGIRVTVRPADFVIRSETFVIHSVVLDKDGHPMAAGDKTLIRLTVQGQANVELLVSTDNGTLTEAIARSSGHFTVTAKLHSIGGELLSRKVEGQTTGVAIDPLEVVPPLLYVAWTDTIQEIQLKHRGGDTKQPVTWSESETATEAQSAVSLAPTGVLTVRGEGEIGVRVQLTHYYYVRATGRVRSAVPDTLKVSSTGFARVGRPHHLHVALTATHPDTGEMYNFHICNCDSFTVSLLEGPELHNLTSAPWIQPVEGACCVVECRWAARGTAAVRVSRGAVSETTRVLIRAAPTLLWPKQLAALIYATVPVLAEGEHLVPFSNDPNIAELTTRDGTAPHRYPDTQLFSIKCRAKGDTRLEVVSEAEDERESVELEVACAPYVSKIRLTPSITPGNCSGKPRIWLRPGHKVKLEVALLDAVGRELLDERGPKMSWEIEPKHKSIQYLATDRLFVEKHPEYEPVPVPYKYYQSVLGDEPAIGWSGLLKTSIPEATASISARVVASLHCVPKTVNMAWEGDTVSNISSVSGGSGQYSVEAPNDVIATVTDGQLRVVFPGPGTYELIVSDLCLEDNTQTVKVIIEEILSVEVLTARAMCVGSCVLLAALVKGVSNKYLTTSRAPEWRASGHVTVKDGKLCGMKEGTGRVRASLGNVMSSEVEVLVFPPLSIVPEKARIPPGARLQLQHRGGPPSHLATLHYHIVSGVTTAEVSSSGLLHGLSTGVARIKLIARNSSDIELASTESEVEVIPISGLRLKASTQTLLVGSPGPVWVEASGLMVSSLAALHPLPKVTWTVRDPITARLYSTHIDDKLERAMAEGLSVRVVPLKPGLVTVDVKVRNMGQVAETRSWDSTIEILAISDIHISVEGMPKNISEGDRLAIAVGSSIRLKSSPRSSWKGNGAGVFEITANGELKTLKPGFGVITAQHMDDRNNIYREKAIHVEVSVPHYCTAEPTGELDDSTVRLVMRSAIGRELIAPSVNATVITPLVAHVRRAANSALGTELLITGLNVTGTFLSFKASVSNVTVKDDVWVTGSDSQAKRVVATGGWGVCIDGVGWRAPPDVSVYAGSDTSLAVLNRDVTATHSLRLDRPHTVRTVYQVPVDKLAFIPGDWPSAMVPLSIEASGVTSGPLLCTEEQKRAMEGVHVTLPYTCRTSAPHTAQPVLNIANNQLGCSIVPSGTVTEPSEIELCVEWGVFRKCTRVLLLPLIEISHTKVSLLKQSAAFAITGHPQALKQVKITTSPGLKVETNTKSGEISVTVKSEISTCGTGWVNVESKLTMQDFKVDVERDCDVACGSLLGAMLSLLKPYLPTLLTLVAVAIAYLYIQQKLDQKAQVRMPKMPPQSVLPPSNGSPLQRPRTWSRSPYAAGGPATPVYGDASLLSDASFTPNTTTTHSSRYLENPFASARSTINDNSFSGRW